MKNKMIAVFMAPMYAVVCGWLFLLERDREYLVICKKIVRAQWRGEEP